MTIYRITCGSKQAFIRADSTSQAVAEFAATHGVSERDCHVTVAA